MNARDIVNYVSGFFHQILSPKGATVADVEFSCVKCGSIMVPLNYHQTNYKCLNCGHLILTFDPNVQIEWGTYADIMSANPGEGGWSNNPAIEIHVIDGGDSGKHEGPTFCFAEIIGPTGRILPIEIPRIDYWRYMSEVRSN
jgi:DNA-directed RNA polymerase subunit RPC12/RpoP